MWRQAAQDEYWKALELLREEGAGNDSEGDNKEPLLYAVRDLIGILREAWDEEIVAKDKLKEYEEKFGNFEELAVRIRIATEEYSKLPKHPLLDAISQNSIRKAVDKYTERWQKEAVKAMVKYDLVKLQLDELQRKLAHYKTKHGRNIRIGDIVKHKYEFGALFIVVSESEDRQSWRLDPLAKGRVPESLKISARRQGLMRRDLLKSVVIEAYEIVDID